MPLLQALQVLFRKHTKSFPSWLLTPTVYYSILLTNAHNDDCYHLVSNVGSQGIGNISIYLSRSSEASYPSEESHCLNLEVTHVCTELFSYKALLLTFCLACVLSGGCRIRIVSQVANDEAGSEAGVRTELSRFSSGLSGAWLFDSDPGFPYSSIEISLRSEPHSQMI